MINIKLDKVKYKIPSKLTELTIGRYQKLKDLNKKDKVKYFGELLNKLGDIPYAVILSMSNKDVKDIANALVVMLAGSDNLLQNYVEVNGVTYKFTENLDLMRFDQFIDLIEMTDNTDLINENIHLISAILYSEVIGKKKSRFKWYKFWKKRKIEDIVEPYNSEGIYKRAALFKEHMTMDVVYGLLVFFSHLKLISMTNSLDSLNQDLVKSQKTSKTKKE